MMFARSAGVVDSRPYRGSCYAGSGRLNLALANIPKVPRLSHEAGLNIGLRIY